MKSAPGNRWLTVLLTLAVAGTTAWAFLERRARTAAETAANFEKRQRNLIEQDAERMRSILVTRERKEHEAGEARKRAEVERGTARLRNLAFKEPVRYQTVRRADIHEILQRKLEEHYTDDDFERLESGYIAMGLLPDGFRLKEKYLALLGEQVAAFYDQHVHQLYLFDHTTLDSVQNRMILAHELTHALQDQHFTLARLPLDAKNNDDRALAASALVEGDATLLMYGYLAENLTPGALRDTVLGSLFQNIEELQNAPRILRESLLFPYMEGAKFCTTLENSGAGGFEAISAAYQRIPSSTAEIYHPHRYLRKWVPEAVTWSQTTLNGEAALADNVLGELGLRVLLTDWVDEPTALKVAEGWKGDRYLVFKGNGKAPALVWKTVWQSASDADAFRQAVTRMWEKRYDAPAPEPAAANNASTLEMSGTGRTLHLVSLSPTDLLLIDAPDAETARQLRVFGDAAPTPPVEATTAQRPESETGS